jgi:hypothetical protein
VASSADGTRLLANVYGGQLYTSSDAGATWTARDQARNWRGVASSADGTRLAAVVYGGAIYTSSDSGVTWTAREQSRWWFAVASSADGNRLVAVDDRDQVYTSSDPLGVASHLRGGSGASAILLNTGPDSFLVLDGDGPLFAY